VLNGQSPLPVRTEIVIVGAGLAGLSCALLLAQAGAKVVVLESNPTLADCVVGRGAGLAQLGLGEHPAQLVSAIGFEDTMALYTLSVRSLQMLDPHAQWSARGELWCASMDREDEAVTRSAACLSQMGFPVELLKGTDLNERLGLSSFPVAWSQPFGGSLAPRALIHDLALKAMSAGVHLQLDFDFLKLTRSAEGLCFQGSQGQCLTELAVFANGWKSATIEPWFEQKVFPVRAQHYWQRGASSLVRAGRTQHGYASWAPMRDGVVVSGCRWGSTHMEVGEWEDVLNQKISGHLAKFMERFISLPEGDPVEWTSVMDFSCDGLPFLGPLPGQARKIACVGFGGQGLGLAMACAEAVVEGILNGVAPSIPHRLHASRLI
jgi:glycine/D-amino acid oxidase-like deaminating enzyme